MDLTSELLLDFMDQSRKYVKKRLSEHRKGGRLSLSAEVQILPDGTSGAAELISATASNLSTCGIALLIPRKLLVGQYFSLRLPSKQSRILWVYCIVMRWHAAATGQMQVGARFCDLICTDSGELPMLIDPTASAEGIPEERRSLCKKLLAVDRELNPVPVDPNEKPPESAELRTVKRFPIRYDSIASLLQTQKKSTPVSIHIQDISTAGVGFVCKTEFPKDARLGFILKFSDKKAKAVLAKVARCIQVGANQYRVGAQLVESCPLDPTCNSLPAHWL